MNNIDTYDLLNNKNSLRFTSWYLTYPDGEDGNEIYEKRLSNLITLLGGLHNFIMFVEKVTHSYVENYKFLVDHGVEHEININDTHVFNVFYTLRKSRNQPQYEYECIIEDKHDKEIQLVIIVPNYKNTGLSISCKTLTSTDDNGNLDTIKVRL